ncbi:adhesion G-protein coupled receptor G4 [Festucalex cinctus]
MTFRGKIFNMAVSVTLLINVATSVMRAPLLSLWGNVAQFSAGCTHWKLEADVFIPTLDQLTVCLHLKFKAEGSGAWSAFMYHHPEVECAILGLGGREDAVVVWLLGNEWTTASVGLAPRQWHSLCLTWSHARDTPTLYVNGSETELEAGDDDITSSASCCEMAANGTLTLGVARRVGPCGDLLASLSLFRVWGRRRSGQEVKAAPCSEGDVLPWSREQWDTRVCAPIPDRTLTCEWSIYKVSLKFIIIRADGNNTEHYTARDIAHRWLEAVLPSEIYLHQVSVSEASRSSAEEASSSMNSFSLLAYVNVIPGTDVAAVQQTIRTKLAPAYTLGPSGLVQVQADKASIQTTPVDAFPSNSTSPAVPTTRRPVTTSTLAASSTQTSANISELFYEVQATVSITGECESPQLLVSTWLNDILSDHMMLVFGLQVLPEDLRRKRALTYSDLSTSDEVSANVSRLASFIFQVEATSSPVNAQKTEALIRDLLLTPYVQGPVSIETQDVQISRILDATCDAESQQTRKGLFEWPDTPGGENSTRPCPKNTQRHATRHCKLSLSTGWMAPNLQECHLVVETIPDLDHVDVTPETALDVVEMMSSLLSNRSELDRPEMVTLLAKMEDVLGVVGPLTPRLGQALVDAVSDILRSDSCFLPFTNAIVNITEAVGDGMVGFQDSATLVAPAVAVSMVDVAPGGHFAGLTFGVSSDGVGSKPQIFLNKFPVRDTVAFMSLPPILQQSFPRGLNPLRVQFQFYGIPELFENHREDRILNSFVVSASVSNCSAPIRDLPQDVLVTLRHLRPKPPHVDTRCVYWNFNDNDGRGGWNSRGCRKHNSSVDFTTCLCDHLTHFGLLLDVSRSPVDEANAHALTVITYVGCGVSSLFLGITVLTYTAFEKLRGDYPSRILINLCVALLGLNLSFLLDSWLSSWGAEALCVAAAAALHYFLLASFTWMGLEGLNMYFALVKVFNVYVPAYMLKFCALGWGIPLAICALVLIVKRDAYGGLVDAVTRSSLAPLDNSHDFCWLQDDVTFYVSVVAYALLVFLFNIAVFVVVLRQIRHMRAKSPAVARGGLMRDLKGVATLTLLLGLTWTSGFFTWGPARVVLLYIFSILNSFQGIFIFLFHCLMKENVRRQWRLHLCFGKFRPEENSDWSHTATAVAKAGSHPLNAGVPSLRSVESNSTESTSASSESGRGASSYKRPDLGVLVQSLVFPRAQSSYPGPQPVTPAHGGGAHARRATLGPAPSAPDM